MLGYLPFHSCYHLLLPIDIKSPDHFNLAMLDSQCFSICRSPVLHFAFVLSKFMISPTSFALSFSSPYTSKWLSLFYPCRLHRLHIQTIAPIYEILSLWDVPTIATLRIQRYITDGRCQSVCCFNPVPTLKPTRCYYVRHVICCYTCIVLPFL